MLEPVAHCGGSTRFQATVSSASTPGSPRMRACGTCRWAPTHGSRTGLNLLDASWKYTGNVGHWAPVTADEELGLFYVPTETPTNDYFGGYRPGANLFGNSILALDAATGERVWHYQLTHHELWDYDLPAAPILVNIEVDGDPHQGVGPAVEAGLRLRPRQGDR